MIEGTTICLLLGLSRETRKGLEGLTLAHKILAELKVIDR